jgi:predicted RNA methylase
VAREVCTQDTIGSSETHGCGSIELAKLLRSSQVPVLDKSVLIQSDVLELGAGTGILAVALGDQASGYTATDLDVLVPLMTKACDRKHRLIQTLT